MKTQKNWMDCSFSNRRRRVLALLFLLVSFSYSAFGQTSTTSAGVTGQVTDPRGAIVPKAVVTLYTRDNRLRFKTLSNEAGKYQFERLGRGSSAR